jgi:hypothetical protein
VSKPIKSSIELAMEKMAKLPRLTKEEVRARQEKEYAPVGQSIARGFLTGALAETRLEAELFKHEDDRGEIVRRAFSAFLCRSIDLEDAKTTVRVLEAIRLLLHDDCPEETTGLLDGLDGLLRDYEQRKQRELTAIEEAGGSCLRELGVSGSAIRPNPRQNERWQRRWDELQQTFAPKTQAIKRELADHLFSSLQERS